MIAMQIHRTLSSPPRQCVLTAISLSLAGLAGCGDSSNRIERVHDFEKASRSVSVPYYEVPKYIETLLAQPVRSDGLVHVMSKGGVKIKSTTPICFLYGRVAVISSFLTRLGQNSNDDTGDRQKPAGSKECREKPDTVYMGLNEIETYNKPDYRMYIIIWQGSTSYWLAQISRETGVSPEYLDAMPGMHGTNIQSYTKADFTGEGLRAFRRGLSKNRDFNKLRARAIRMLSEEK
jgi:hypothetical protein